MSPDPISAGAAAKTLRAGAGWIDTLLRARKFTLRHDRLALRAYEDLTQWAKRERNEQQERLSEVDREIEDELYYSTLHQRQQAEARELSAEKWRSEKLKTTRLIEDLGDTENVVHSIVRRVARRLWPPPNPFFAEMTALARNWEIGVQPRTVETPPPEFQRLVDEAPELGRLYTEAASLADPGDTRYFCANRVWYGRFRSQVVEQVGFRAWNPKLRTTSAYDLGYQTIYNALPDCRNCGELGMPAEVADV